MKTHHLLLMITTMISASASAYAQDAVSLYNEGLLLKKQGKGADASMKFEQAVALNPAYTEARYELGWCQNDAKKYNEAISNLRKVRTAWPGVTKVYFELGWAFEKTNQLDSAVKAYYKCLEIKPDYAGVFKQLGYIAYTKEDYTTALNQFGQYELNAKDSITDYYYWYKKGFANNALKNYSGAVAALNKSVRYKQDYTNTWLELGFANSKLKNDEEAIADYRKAIDLDPKSHIGYNGIGEVYRDNKKDMNQAMHWYRKTLAMNPTERKACFGMGYCLNAGARYTDAIPYLKKAVEMENTYTAAYVELGYSYYKTSAFDDAIANFNKAISLNPANENSRYYLTLLYIDQNNKAKAKETLEALKKLSSKHVQTLQPKVDAM